MRPFASIALALLASFLATACVSPLLSAEDRKEACRVAVDEKFGSPVFRSNSLSSGAGTLSGAGKGALAGMNFGTASILTMPLGLLIGAGYGTSCAIAGAQHPTADADFERLLHEADSGSLKRALEARLKTPREECAASAPAAPPDAPPDAVIEIEKIEAGMACLHGRQEFWVAAKWRTVSKKAGRVLNEATTRREHESTRTVDDWFAHPVQARSEIEQVLGEIGQAMAMQFVGEDSPAR